MAKTAIEVTGIDHIYVTVSEMGRSEAFYDQVMRLLGFKKSSGPLAGGDYHVHYFNRLTQYTIRPAKDRSSAHDRFSPGLNHLCFRVADKRQVDVTARGLEALGCSCTPPRLYPEYAADYYATFFSDPDGIRLEVTNHRQERRDIVENWDRLPWTTGCAS